MPAKISEQQDIPDKAAAPAGKPRAQERRSTHRVKDNQGTGQGSESALSALRMRERRKDLANPDREH